MAETFSPELNGLPTIQEEAQKRLDERTRQRLVEVMARKLEEKKHYEDMLSRIALEIQMIEEGKYNLYSEGECREELGSRRY